MENKGKIVLSRTINKINNGEYDHYLKYPFMTRKLMKALVKERINKEVEQGNNPILSETDIKEIVSDMEETSKETFKAFLNAGILEIKDGHVQLSDKLK